MRLAVELRPSVCFALILPSSTAHHPARERAVGVTHYPCLGPVLSAPLFSDSPVRRGYGRRADAGLLPRWPQFEVATIPRLTGKDWHYLKVPQAVFTASTASTFDQLMRHVEAFA